MLHVFADPSSVEITNVTVNANFQTLVTFVAANGTAESYTVSVRRGDNSVHASQQVIVSNDQQREYTVQLDEPVLPLQTYNVTVETNSCSKTSVLAWRSIESRKFNRSQAAASWFFVWNERFVSYGKAPPRCERHLTRYQSGLWSWSRKESDS